MNKNKNHIEIHTHLSQQELIDYNNGVLGNEEMYRMELHLNECELCNDALEGFDKIKNPDRLLTSVQNEILPTSQKFKINYLAIAASVVLITAFGFSYWLFDNPSKDENIALNTVEKQEIKNKVAEIKEEDLSEEIDNPIDDVVEEEMVKESEETTTPKETIERAKPAITYEPINSDSRKAEPIESSNSIADAEIIEENLQAGIEAPKEESDQFQEDDIEISGAEQSVALQAMPSVSRSAKKSTAKTTIATLKDQKEPIPVGGMEALKNHIATNLKYPQQAIDNKTKGTVVLDVTISTDGSIKNIAVSKGIGSGCDAEAMRLISNGPIWKPKVVNGVAIDAVKQVKVKFKN